MAVKSIILECITGSMNEDVILQAVSNEAKNGSAETMSESIQSDLKKHFSYTSLEYGLMFDGDLAKISEYFQLFGNYLDRITKMLSKFDKIAQSFRKSSNSKLIETVLDFIKNLSTINSSTSTLSKSRWCNVKSEFASKLCAFLFDLYDPSCIVETMKQMQHEQITSVSYDRCMISNVIKLLVLQPVS